MKSDFNAPQPATLKRFHCRAMQAGTGNSLYYEADTMEELQVMLYGSAYPAERASVQTYDNSERIRENEIIQDIARYGPVLCGAVHDIPLDEIYAIKSKSESDQNV